MSANHQWKLLRRFDLQNLRLQAVVPYQGLAQPRELIQAMRLLRVSHFADGVPGFPPIFRGEKRRQLCAAIEIIHGLDFPFRDPRTAAIAYHRFSPQIPTLLAFSIPSLLPTLQHFIDTMTEVEAVATDALKWYGDCAHYFKDYRRAKIAYTRLLNDSKKLNKEALLAHAHRGLGDCALKLRDYSDALRHYRCACKLYEHIGRNESLPRAYRSLADADRALGHNASAIRMYRKAGTLAQKYGQRWNYSKTLQELGWTEWKCKNLEAALANFSSALLVHKELDRSRGRFTCYFAIARLMAFKRLDQATLHPDPEETEIAKLLGHRPWKERAAILGLPE